MCYACCALCAGGEAAIEELIEELQQRGGGVSTPATSDLAVGKWRLQWTKQVQGGVGQWLCFSVSLMGRRCTHYHVGKGSGPKQSGRAFVTAHEHP